MKLANLLAIFLLVVPRFSWAADQILSILPNNKHVTARVMQSWLPPDMEAIGRRWKAALASQPEWTAEYLAKRPAGQLLPYDPHFGITQQEYQTLTQALASLKLRQVATVELSTRVANDESVVLQITGGALKLNGAIFNIDGTASVLKMGTLSESHAVKNENANSPTGRWIGRQWEQKIMPGETGTVRIGLGKRTDEGDGIIYLRYLETSGGKTQEFTETLLFPVSK